MSVVLGAVQDEIRFGPFRLTPAARLLLCDDAPVSLSSRALDLLVALAERPGEVVSKAELMARAWPNVVVEEGALRVQIVGLRKALGGTRYITNVPGRGYCFVGSVDETAHPANALGEPQAPPDQRPASAPAASSARLIGRDNDVEAIVMAVRDHRFVSIVGPGGIGKTSVALAVADVVQSDFEIDVHLIELAPLCEPELVCHEIAARLGLPVHSTDPIPAIVAHLRADPCLLLIDNCEHVIGAVAEVAERIYQSVPDVQIITTSREVLRAEGEHVFFLPSLGSPAADARLTLEEALAYPAIRLFLERAEAGGARLMPNVEQLTSVASICEKMDGIALAIELAAGRVRTYGLEGTAALIESRFWLNWQGRRTAQPRHQTLAAMLDWSFRLLSVEEQLVLRRLSIFNGSFGLDDAQRVAAGVDLDPRAVVDLLGELVAKSLVSRQARMGDPHFSLLETTRAFAARQLLEAGEVDEMERRRALLMIERLNAAVGEEDEGAGATRPYDSDFVAEVRAALKWAYASDRHVELAASLAAAATPHLLRLSLLPECEQWSEAGLTLLKTSEPGSEMVLALTESRAIASMFTKGNSEEVHASIIDALALAERRQDTKRQLSLLAGLNIFVTRTGNFREALDCAERSRIVAERAGDAKAMVIAEWMLGVAHHLRDNQLLARDFCEKGFVRSQIIGSFDATIFGYDHRTRALVALARSLWLTGAHARAVDVATQVSQEASRSDHAVNACIALVYASSVMLWAGHFEEAARIIDRLIELASAHSLEPYRVTGLAQRGELLIETDHVQRGLDTLSAAIWTLDDERHQVLSPTFARAYAKGLILSGRPAEADPILDRIIGKAELDGAYDLAEHYRVKGEGLLGLGQATAAQDCFAKGVAAARAAGSISWELRLAMSRVRSSAVGPQQEIALDELRQLRVLFDDSDHSVDLASADQLLSA